MGVVVSASRGRRVLVTIGYGDPEAIDMQAAGGGRGSCLGVLYVVADNSTDNAVAREIAAIAGRHGAPYVRLPRPLLLEEGPSRSHGLALDWQCGYVDPAWACRRRSGSSMTICSRPRRTIRSRMLRQQPVYGALRRQGERWFLWAGFLSASGSTWWKDLKLNFGQDWFKGLDTGGG